MNEEKKEDCKDCEFYRKQGWGFTCKKCRKKINIPKGKFDEALEKIGGIGKGKI